MQSTIIPTIGLISGILGYLFEALLLVFLYIVWVKDKETDTPQNTTLEFLFYFALTASGLKVISALCFWS